MNKVIALEDKEGLCWNCLKIQNHIHRIVFEEQGYGSSFDSFATELHLCDDCYNMHPEYWKLNKHKVDIWGYAYDFEDEIFEYVSKMPLEGRQFFFNEFDTGSNAHSMKPQDWIDYELGILPFEKCKEYGLYAIEEIKAYKERFPSCQYPMNRKFNDGSIACWCPFGAIGDKDQKIGVRISDSCFNCRYYKPRKTPLKIIENDKWDEYAFRCILENRI